MAPYEAGKLYMRLRNNKVEDLFFPTQSQPADAVNFWTQSLARVIENHGRRDTGMGLEDVRNGGKTGSGDTITTRPATDTDLRYIIRTWNDSFRLDRWMEEVAQLDTIQSSEVERLRKILHDCFR